MSRLFEIETALNSFCDKITDNISLSVRSVDYMLLDLNREQMLFRQVDAFDNAISPPYNPNYKAKAGKKTSNPDLFDTGDFQKKMILNTNGEKFEIHSTDWKDLKLREKYGDQIHGVAPSNQTKAYSITNGAIGLRLRKEGLLR